MNNDGRGDRQGGSNPPADYGGNKFSFANGFEDSFPSQQAYSSDTPAKQHERLLYMKTEQSSRLPYLATENSQLTTSASFLDDKFPSSLVEGRQSITDGARNPVSNPQHWGSFNNSVQNGAEVAQPSASLKNEELDFLFSRNDDGMSSLADDLSSSFGSSLHSELLASSYDSFQYQPQSLNGPSAGAPLSSHLSPPVKSPSSSVRAGSYLSASLRNGSAGTPGLMGTPRTRHASLSGSHYPDGYLSVSVPKNLTADERLKRKREFHNAVERRRRELIKQKIKELGNIVPPSLLNYDVNGKRVKPNKGIILNKTVEYLEYLLQVMDVQDRRKKQLLAKLNELEEKRAHLATNQETEQSHHKISHTSERQPSQEPDFVATSVAQSDFDGVDEDVSNERIIDTRAKPQPHGFGIAQPWGEPNSFGLVDNLLSNHDHNLPVHDDLQQFLSGDLIEAEDNAKLIFNNGDRPDFLLDFDS